MYLYVNVSYLIQMWMNVCQIHVITVPRVKMDSIRTRVHVYLDILEKTVKQVGTFYGYNVATLTRHALNMTLYNCNIDKTRLEYDIIQTVALKRKFTAYLKFY